MLRAPAPHRTRPPRTTFLLSIHPAALHRLVIFAYVFYTAMFLLPFSQKLLKLDLSNPGTMAVGLTTGLIGAVLVELFWWLTAGLRGEQPRLWRVADPAA